MKQPAEGSHVHDPLPSGCPGAAAPPSRARFLWPYLLAVLCVAVAVSLTVFVPPLKEKTSLIMFFAAVVVSSYAGGLGPALLAVFLSALAWATLVVPPDYSYKVDSPADMLRLLLFVLVAVLTSSLYERHARTKRELRKQQNRLDLALEAGRMGVWDYDLQRDEFWISPAFQDILGVRPAEFAATYGAFLAFVHPEDRAAVVRAMTTSRESNVDYQIEYRLLRRDGSVHRIATRGRTFVDQKGRAERMIGLVVDLTDSPEGDTMTLSPHPTAASGDAGPDAPREGIGQPAAG